MKERMVALLLFITILLSFINVSLAEDFTFRKTKWGMSESDVKASEPLEIAESGDGWFSYKTNVLGKDVYVVYIFIDNQLVRSRYILAESYTNNNNYIDVYQSFKSILEKKYGKPVEDQTIWMDDNYKNDYSDWGMAVSLGDLTFYSTWINNSTEITNTLSGNNFSITCCVEYRSTKLKDIEEKAIENKAMEDF